ncbi:hypothetical protein ACGF0K_21000 [Streptomyces sp. NPDC048156]|uniref:hypothetical protein n=1 Tax=Streptomyces sp. NPDC048156 TaxID=3365502 RepID=UPI00371EBA90
MTPVSRAGRDGHDERGRGLKSRAPNRAEHQLEGPASNRTTLNTEPNLSAKPGLNQ